MPGWSNWSGKLQARPRQLHFLRSEADAQALVIQAVRDGVSMRAAGATHSHAPLVKHDGIIVDSGGLSGVIQTDRDEQTAWVWAGSRMYTLGRPLHDAGMALFNQGDIDQQAIAGATATGTHGTGISLKNLSAQVTGMRIVLASGDIVDCSPGNHAELWHAARLHLGAFGIVTRINLQLRDAYRLREHTWEASLDEVLGDSQQQIAGNRHFEFFWYPQTDQAQVKTLNETVDPPEYPLAEEGRRCAWNYETLPNHRPHKHTEMEYSVPFAAGPQCMRDIAALLRHDFPNVRWPVEYRSLAADDVWLSTANGRDTVTVSVHEDVGEDERPYFKACEEIFLSHGGRPHWGKVHYLDGKHLQAAHPHWEQWWAVRDAVDPAGSFLNDYLKSLRT